MKNGMLWIGLAVAVIGVAVAGGLLLSRGGGSAAASSTPLSAATSTPAERTLPVASTPVAVVGPTPLAAETSTAPTVSTGESLVVSAAPVEVAIIDLIKKQDQFTGKVVTVKGQVLTQCMAGCEFNVDDGTGTLNVKLEGDALDQLIAKGSVGKKVVVTGVFVRDPRPQIILEKTGGWRFQ
jgi:hypothetical protein